MRRAGCLAARRALWWWCARRRRAAARRAAENQGNPSKWWPGVGGEEMIIHGMGTLPTHTAGGWLRARSGVRLVVHQSVQPAVVASRSCYRAYFPHLGFHGFPTTHSTKYAHQKYQI